MMAWVSYVICYTVYTYHTNSRINVTFATSDKLRITLNDFKKTN